MLLRRLVHATGKDLREVDFPGFDNAQRHGTDGFVDAGTGTPWIAEGCSFWAFGKDASRESAGADCVSSVTNVDPDHRAAAPLGFLTPRNRPGQRALQERKQAAGDWRATRARDASDLERWLEQSPATHTRLADELGQRTNGLDSLDHARNRRADAIDPNLDPLPFAPSIAIAKRMLVEKLAAVPGRPILVAADSCDEPLAFLSCVLHEPEWEAEGDRTVIVTSRGALNWLAASDAARLPIVVADDVGDNLAPILARFPAIVWRPSHVTDQAADLTVEPLGQES